MGGGLFNNSSDNNLGVVKMKKTYLLMIVAATVIVFQAGCDSGGGTRKTGFLSDYSRLRTESSSTMRYLNQQALSRYSSFIVDPVEVYFHSGSKAVEEKTKGELSQQQIDDTRNYMHAKIEEAVRNAGKQLAYRPAPGVARIRTAITDIDKSTAASLMPVAKVAGAGIGGASMEAEIVDSKTGEQVAALVESRKGSRMPLADLGKWDAAKSVIDAWARRLQSRLQ
jgi:hypothetical protein